MDGEVISGEWGPEQDEVIRSLVKHHEDANGVIMKFVTFVGGFAESGFSKLPAPVRHRSESIIQSGLERAYGLGRIAARPEWSPNVSHGMRGVATGATGFVAGFGGTATAAVEVSMSICVIMSSIQKVAEENGFDADDDAILIECLKVFGSGGPLEEDDGVETGFLGARIGAQKIAALPAVDTIIARIVPRVAAIFGPKVASQTVPVVSGIAAMTTNIAFIRYYERMARVRFGLLKLSREGGYPADEVNKRFVDAVKLRRRELASAHGASASVTPAER